MLSLVSTWMEVRLGWETFLLIVRIEFICKSHALCNLSHGRMNIWGDSVHGQISFPYTQKTMALEQKTQKTTALEQKTVFRSRAAVFWVYGKLIWPWYEESNTWFLLAILSLGPDSEKVRLVCLFVCFNGRPGKSSLTREYPIGWDLAHVQEQINALLPSDEGIDE